MISTTKRLRRAAVWAVQIALTIVITWAILARIDVSLRELASIDPARWRPSLLPLAASALVLLAGFVLAAWFWGRLATVFGGQPLGFRDVNRIYFLANLGRYLPGKVWQIAGLAYLAREHGVQPLAATGAALLGQALTLVGALLIGAGCLAWTGDSGSLRVPGWALPPLAIGAAVLLVPPLFRRIVVAVFRAARQSAPDLDGIDPLFGARWLALYSLAWIIYGISFWIFARAFHVSVGLAASAGAFAAAYLVGYLAVFAPAGIGVREGILAAALTPYVEPAAALALALLARVWTTVVEVLPAVGLGLWGARAAEAASGSRGEGRT
ncbi:MAG: flippase-like domain-containing protein [Gemmatimonadetes bacterium]|nr:flippase-like domain-containing protein [Gemmatimonadota bacterium]